MTQTAISTEGPLVLVGAQNGVALIPSPTPLTRLNYFDGKFLRAEDMNREQLYLRSLVQMSNRAGGAGIVHGFEIGLGSDATLELSPGLAIDPAGRVLFLPHAASLSIIDLVERSKQTPTGSTSRVEMGESAFSPCEIASAPPPDGTTTFPTDLYLIALAHAEALCGEEDVYGRLCEDACVTSTDRPFRTEGVVVRAIPLSLLPPTCDAPWLTARHRRSQVASAYFATERALLGKNITGSRLRTDLWCKGAAAQSGTVVPLGVVSLNGSTVDFLDAWIARRERIESPPRRYWAWQTMMRPWNVFLAQVLQFQCQLHSHLADAGTPDLPDPCEDRNQALKQAVDLIEEMERSLSSGDSTTDFRPDFVTRISDLKSQWSATLESGGGPRGTRILIDGGIVELPPAGYLPVVPGKVDVNTQVRRLLGEGVDLRFCSVRPDYVAHAMEEAQHLERICLLHGLENPTELEEVDILVPDGVVTEAPAQQGIYFETNFGVGIPSISIETPNDISDDDAPAGGASVGGMTINSRGSGPETFMRSTEAIGAAPVGGSRNGPQFRGAGRGERLSSGGGAFHFAGLMLQSAEQVLAQVDQSYTNLNDLSARERKSRTASEKPIFDLNLNQVFTRFAGGARKATAERARKEAAEADTPSGNAARMASLGEKPQAGLEQQVRIPPTPPALWTTFRCEKDPFTMPVGASSPLRMEAALGASYQGAMIGGRLILQGDLFCDQATSSASGRRVAGRARGWIWASVRLQQGSQVQTHQGQPIFIPVKAEIELEPAPGGKGGTLAITVTTGEGFEFSITTQWNGSPVLAELNLTVDLIDTLLAMAERVQDDPERRQMMIELAMRLEKSNPEYRAIRIGNARLRENADVAREANSHHASAVKAMRTIGHALDEDAFHDSASQLLFPAAPPQTAEKRVLPTRDWVLFHRRRPNSCDCCTAKTRVIAPPRRFQVYEVTAPEQTSAESIRRGLTSGASIEKWAEIVGVVEFQGDSARLTGAGSNTEILEGWRLANPADLIIYGGIASEGAAMNDGEALDEQRLARVSDLVKSMTPFASAVQFDVLPLVPNGLSAQGVDGVIFLVTMPSVVGTQRHRVISLRDQGMMDFVVRGIQAGEDLQEIVEGNIPLSDVVFEAGTRTILDDTIQPVIDGWQKEWDTTTVGRAVVVLPTTNSIPADVAGAQGNAIAAALGGRLTETMLNADGRAFDDVDAVTILEPS